MQDKATQIAVGGYIAVTTYVFGIGWLLYTHPWYAVACFAFVLIIMGRLTFRR